MKNIFLWRLLLTFCLFSDVVAMEPPRKRARGEEEEEEETKPQQPTAPAVSLTEAQKALYDALRESPIDQNKVRQALEHGANAQSWQGLEEWPDCPSPLMCVFQKNGAEAARLLLEYGAKISRENLASLMQSLNLTAFIVLIEFNNITYLMPTLFRYVVRHHMRTTPGSREAAHTSAMIVWLLTHFNFSSDPKTIPFLKYIMTKGILTTPEFGTQPFNTMLKFHGFIIYGKTKKALKLLQEYISAAQQQAIPYENYIKLLNYAFTLAVATQNHELIDFLTNNWDLTEETRYDAFQTAILHTDLATLELFTIKANKPWLTVGSQWHAVLTRGLRIAIARREPKIVELIIQIANELAESNYIAPLDIISLIDFCDHLMIRPRRASDQNRLEEIRSLLWQQVPLRELYHGILERVPELPLPLQEQVYLGLFLK